MGKGLGYIGQSMSVNARFDLLNDVKPLNHFKKSDLDDINDFLDSQELPKLKNMASLKRALKGECCQTWHHMGKYFNKVDFYNLEDLKELTEKKILFYNIPDVKPKAKKRYKANLIYLEWSGTRKHPKAEEKEILGCWIEEKGSTYYIYNRWNSKSPILTKRINCNGLQVKAL